MSRAVFESLRRLQKKQAPSGPPARTSRPGPTSTPRRENGPQRAPQRAPEEARAWAVMEVLNEALERVSRVWSQELEDRLAPRRLEELRAAEEAINETWQAGEMSAALGAVKAWEALWLEACKQGGTL